MYCHFSHCRVNNGHRNDLKSTCDNPAFSRAIIPNSPLWHTSAKSTREYVLEGYRRPKRCIRKAGIVTIRNCKPQSTISSSLAGGVYIPRKDSSVPCAGGVDNIQI